MLALVTGAAGFLGRRIVRRLVRGGATVRALVRPGCAVDLPGAEVLAGDVCDESTVAEALRGADCVVHAAARVATTGRWEEFAAVNVRATRRVLWAAHAAGVRRIVHISSLSVYAVPADGVTLTEDSPYESESEARGAYSRSKLAADRVAMDAARRGVPVVVLRPGLLYGPGRRPPLARQSLTVNGFKFLLARPDYCLPMTHVDNVADAVWLAAHTDAAVGQAFTVVDENVRQADYARQYRTAAGETWRAVFLPVTAVAWGARAVEYGCRALRRRPPVTYHQVQRATRSAYYDCARAATVLGWRPSISVADGLREVFASLRETVPSPTTSATSGGAV